MLKTVLAATTALTLMSGIGFAETSYSTSTTQSTAGVPSHDVDISKTTRRTGDDGTTVEKNKTVSKNFDHGDVTVNKTKTVNKDFDHDHDGVMAEKDKTITKDTTISANGGVTKKKSETTTIR
jgi:hypothetical protein